MKTFSTEDFNLEDAPREMVQYVLDNVDDFDERYQHALRVIGVERCPLRVADCVLYDDIQDAVDEWCEDNDTDADDIDIEEIFG